MPLDIPFIDPTGIDSAAFNSGIFVLFHAEAVIDLHFISAHQIYTRIRVLRYTKFDVNLYVAKFLFGDQFSISPAGSVYEDPLTSRDGKSLRVRRAERNLFGNHPVTGRLAPATQVFAVKERLRLYSGGIRDLRSECEEQTEKKRPTHS